MPPEMQPVESESVAAIGYDEATDELYVRFHDSGTYVYADVPRDVFDDFARADSKGSFLNQVLKPRFSYRRV